MPPPRSESPASPPRTASLAKVTRAFGCTSKTRSRPSPSTMVAPTPAPITRTRPRRSRSPVAASSSPAPAIVSTYSPAGTRIRSGPASAFASCTAARRVQLPPAVSHTPSPGVASTASAVLSTRKVAASTDVATSSRKAQDRVRSMVRLSLGRSAGATPGPALSGPARREQPGFAPPGTPAAARSGQDAYCAAYQASASPMPRLTSCVGA